MGDELRGESLVHLNVRFSTETELKAIQDMLYEKSGQGVSFTGLVEAMAHEVTIVTAIHNIKSNKGSKTAGVDKMKMDKYLQMPKNELILLIQSCFRKYQPKPARREYIPKSNGKMRPLGIPTVLDRIIQECVRLIIEPICEARFYPHSYGFRPYRAQKHAIRDIINVINAGCKSPDQAVWAVEGDIQGCFDNISHRILLQKVWRMGIHDKRVLKIISQMLKAGYIERDLYHRTETGTPQGGILSPLLSNIYMNDFDWYVGRTYMEPHRKCKHKCNDKVQALLQRDTRTSPKGREVHLFSGFLKCADCGRAITRSVGNNNNVYYACSTYKNRSRTACTMHSIKHNRLEAAVLFAVQQQVHLAVSYSEMIARINTAPVKKSQSIRLEELIAAKERELAKISRYKQSLYQDWKDGEITQQDYRDMKADYERQTIALMDVLARLNAERAELANGVKSEHPALVAFTKHQNIDQLSRELLVELIDHIKVYENGNISVRFKFADEFRRIAEYIEINTTKPAVAG